MTTTIIRRHPEGKKAVFHKQQRVRFLQDNITAYVPKSHTSNNAAKGLFRREDFQYRPATDEYCCPAGERMIWRFQSIERGKTFDTYWSSACPSCPMKDQCTTSKYRRIRRWVHESVLESSQERLAENPNMMRLRRQTVEHPFGTIKSWMGYTHFLTKTLPRVKTEMSLHVLAYNLKRMMQMFGTVPLMEAMRA